MNIPKWRNDQKKKDIPMLLWFEYLTVKFNFQTFPNTVMTFSDMQY